MFAQQFLQPELSRRRYAGFPYALQNNTVFRRAQNWVSDSDGSRTDNGSDYYSKLLDQKQQNILKLPKMLLKQVAQAKQKSRVSSALDLITTMWL